MDVNLFYHFFVCKKGKDDCIVSKYIFILRKTQTVMAELMMQMGSDEEHSNSMTLLSLLLGNSSSNNSSTSSKHTYL